MLNPAAGEFDAVVVHQSTAALSRIYRLHCPRTKILCVLKEPPNLLRLPEAYTKQFQGVLGQFEFSKAKNAILGQSGHHWFVEIPLSQLLKTPEPKRALMSAVVSNKCDTHTHRRRYELLLRLKAHFGERLDWFGRGVCDTGPNKLVGLKDYRYHIVIENGSWDHYWTEKLADAFAANCLPFYWGAPNVNTYFPSSSFVSIDLYNVEKTIKIIEESIRADLFTQRQTALQQARVLLSERYHPFQTYADVLDSLPPSTAEAIEVRPHTAFHFSPKQRLEMKLESLFSVPSISQFSRWRVPLGRKVQRALDLSSSGGLFPCDDLPMTERSGFDHLKFPPHQSIGQMSSPVLEDRKP